MHWAAQVQAKGPSNASAGGTIGARDGGALVVMRHSVRLDQDEKAEWDDRLQRPYDTPIVDFELPARQAQLIAKAVNGVPPPVFPFGRLASPRLASPLTSSRLT